MIEQLAEALQRYTDCQDGESPFATPISGLGILRSDHPKPPNHMISRPSLCIVAQGAKWGTFGDTRLEYRAGQALLVGVETPSVGRVVEASPGEPCLVMVVLLDLAIMRSVANELEHPPQPSGEAGRGVFVTDFQGPLADCALRLVRLLNTPQAIPSLFPGIMREICYWLLTGPHGGDVARLALKNGAPQRVIEAVQSLREHFREPVRVEALAAAARMSPSAFHRQFRALTSPLTPLQVPEAPAAAGGAPAAGLAGPERRNRRLRGRLRERVAVQPRIRPHLRRPAKARRPAPARGASGRGR